MIFAMVGMHTTGFDRLVRALDEYAGRHPDQEVVIQSGSGGYRPRTARAFAYKGDLQADLAAADIVVSHGSVGFLDALRLGKRLAVAPRLSRFGEAIDDHQLEFSRAFARRFGFPVITEMQDLEGVLEKLAHEPPRGPVAFAERTPLHVALESYLDSLAGGSPT